MAFSMRDFMMKGLTDAAKQGLLADYQIRLKAKEYLGKGVLSEADLNEIEKVIENRDAVFPKEGV